MTGDEFYYTIERAAVAEFRDRGSQFIGYAFPVGSVDECKERLRDLRKEHPKATHYCCAYRVGPDGQIFRASDDGEPSGTAGRPILGQIDSRGVVNVLVVVVRYFGGTLLGVPGLINAYKTAAALVLQTTPLVRKQVEKQFVLQFDYTQVGEVMGFVKRYQCRILEQEMQLFCRMVLAVPGNRVGEIREKLGELKNVEFTPVG